jgi:hypothetical protein
MRGPVLIAAGALWLVGCAQDPLARHNVYWGLSPFNPPSGPLVEVLDTSSDTPAKQGLLYTAMRDAEIAATYTDRAISRRNEPGETARAIGEVINAIEPAEAPDWAAIAPRSVRERDAWDYGAVPNWNAGDYDFAAGREVPGWGSQGYGLNRALAGMTDEVATTTDRDAALRDDGTRALGCIDNTEDRAARVVALSQQVLARGDANTEATLSQIDELAAALNRGVPAPGAGGCGLEDVHRLLNQAVGTPRTG